MEEHGYAFALCGSSARKVRRGAANLLGGRALRYELQGLSAMEMGDEFHLSRALNRGYLPRHYQSESYRKYLRSYVGDYLREEIAAEGLVRNLPIFSRFLDISALGDTEQSNYATVARDCRVSAHTVRSYYEILEDTLLGAWCHAYRKKPKRRLSTAPKFYYHDVGVVNHLAKRRNLVPGSAAFGKAFENWVFHELHCHNAYKEHWEEIRFWRLSTGVEVDFILGDMELAIEAKATTSVTSDHLKGLRELAQEHPVGQRLLVCLEPIRRLTDDGILILPAEDWVKSLWAGEWS